jgi:hypothetical protein
VSNLPADATIKTLVATIKARWVCEQAHQQLKEELGRDHFEGRSWTGLHRHALMTMIAYAFPQSRRLKAAGRRKRISGPPPQPRMPAIRQAILDLFARPPPRQCPRCDMFLADIAMPKVVLASLAGGTECVVLRHNVRLRRTSVGRIWLFQLGQASEEARCSQIANAYIE